MPRSALLHPSGEEGSEYSLRGWSSRIVRPSRVEIKATIRILLSSLLGFDPRGYRDRLDRAPARVNVVDFRDAVRARLMLFNDASHYARDPRHPAHNLSRWWDAPPQGGN